MIKFFSDIRDSILELAFKSKEMNTIKFETADISLDNFETDCYEVMNEVMFSFCVAPESISFEDSYCIFEYKGLFFWIGFNVNFDDKTTITISSQTDFNDFKFYRPQMKISDRCDGWAEDGLYSWMNDI